MSKTSGAVPMVVDWEQPNTEKKKQTKRAVPKALKRQVWLHRVGNVKEGKCYVCKRTIYDDNFEASHIIAEAVGGQMTVSNLQPACGPCNRSCATKQMDKFKDMCSL